MKCHYLVHGYIRKQFNIIAHDIIDIIPPYLITVIIVLSYCDVKTKYFGYCCICDSYSSLLDTVYREFDIDQHGFGSITHFKYPYKDSTTILKRNNWKKYFQASISYQDKRTMR